MIAHELAHIKNHDTLTMTITATIAGAISMLAQFGMFFGGNRDNNNGARHHRHAGDGDPRADRRHAGADGDQPHARIRRRRSSARRSPGSPTGSPRRWPRSRTPRTRSRTRRPSAIRRPRTCSSSIRCPAHGMDNLFSTHPVDREPDRRAAAARARDGPWRPAAGGRPATPAGRPVVGPAGGQSVPGGAWGNKSRGPWG